MAMGAFEDEEEWGAKGLWPDTDTTQPKRSSTALACTHLEVDIGVEDSRREAHDGWADRVVGPHLDADLEAAPFVRRVGGATDGGLDGWVGRGDGCRPVIRRFIY